RGHAGIGGWPALGSDGLGDLLLGNLSIAASFGGDRGLPGRRRLLGLAARVLLGLALRALLGLAARLLLLGAEGAAALADHVADGLGDGQARADGVVVAGDDVVDAVGIAVGVHQADERNAQALRLAHGDRLRL